MAQSVKSAKTAKKTTKNSNQQVLMMKNHLFTMIAAFAGVVFGVVGSLGFMANYIHSEFATETANLKSQVVKMVPSADVTTSTCSVPSSGGTGSGSNTSSVVTATAPANSSTWTPPAQGGKGGGDVSIGNQWTKDSGSISNTGPDSTNKISFVAKNTTTVTNTNNVNVSSNNSQSAGSGSANVSGNTTGGSATSGEATNTNNTSVSLSVDNN